MLIVSAQLTRWYQKMKNIRSYGKRQAIKELAHVFDKELETNLPVAVMPDCSLVVGHFQVKKLAPNKWAIICISSKDAVDEFFLKSCALIAAKARAKNNFTVLLEIKQLDRLYFSHKNNVSVFEHSIEQRENADRVEILTTRLEHELHLLSVCRDKIESMFRSHFA